MQDSLPKRKTMRMREYDYSKNGVYFITLCLQDKRNLLWEKSAVGANCVRPLLSQSGMIVEREIAELSCTYPGIRVDKQVVMPNHVHMMIVIALTEAECGRTRFAPTVSRVIKQYKGSVSKQLGMAIWQKSFYDRIIRDEAEYLKIWQYIDENPARWAEDVYYDNTGDE